MCTRYMHYACDTECLLHCGTHRGQPNLHNASMPNKKLPNFLFLSLCVNVCVEVGEGEEKSRDRQVYSIRKQKLQLIHSKHFHLITPLPSAPTHFHHTFQLYTSSALALRLWSSIALILTRYHLRQTLHLNTGGQKSTVTIKSLK